MFLVQGSAEGLLKSFYHGRLGVNVMLFIVSHSLEDFGFIENVEQIDGKIGRGVGLFIFAPASQKKNPFIIHDERSAGMGGELTAVPGRMFKSDLELGSLRFFSSYCEELTIDEFQGRLDRGNLQNRLELITRWQASISRELREIFNLDREDLPVAILLTRGSASLTHKIKISSTNEFENILELCNSISNCDAVKSFPYEEQSDFLKKLNSYEKRWPNFGQKILPLFKQYDEEHRTQFYQVIEAWVTNEKCFNWGDIKDLDNTHTIDRQFRSRIRQVIRNSMPSNSPPNMMCLQKDLDEIEQFVSTITSSYQAKKCKNKVLEYIKKKVSDLYASTRIILELRDSYLKYFDDLCK